MLLFICLFVTKARKGEHKFIVPTFRNLFKKIYFNTEINRLSYPIYNYGGRPLVNKPEGHRIITARSKCRRVTYIRKKL